MMPIVQPLKTKKLTEEEFYNYETLVPSSRSLALWSFFFWLWKRLRGVTSGNSSAEMDSRKKVGSSSSHCGNDCQG